MEIKEASNNHKTVTNNDKDLRSNFFPLIETISKSKQNHHNVGECW